MSEDKNEKITLDKQVYLDILNRLGKLEKGDRRELPTVVKEHLARVREYKGSIVIKMGKITKIWDDRNREYKEVVDIFTEDKKEHKDVNYLDFLATAKIIVGKIKDIKKKEVITNQGMVEVRKLDKNGNLVETGEQTPANVITLDETVKLELPDGKIIKINSNYLNI